MTDALERVLAEFRTRGAVRMYAKRLAPNDNSKNQVYLGSGFAALNVLPHGELLTVEDDVAGAVRSRTKARLTFAWMTRAGLAVAPEASLILYPGYPEVRMSGFLRGCPAAPTALMTSRQDGRTLFLGVTADGVVMGHVAPPDAPEAIAVAERDWPTLGVFLQLPLSVQGPSTRSLLLQELHRIAGRGWIPSVKLAPGGVAMPYAAMNGGGYTLEAELGVSPNGHAEPDFLGWEIKQYGVHETPSARARSPVTLMTPDPTGGLYRSEDAEGFIRRFGYAARDMTPDRINFGGRYDGTRSANRLTGLRMQLIGYDRATGTISDVDGCVALVTAGSEIAASWSFRHLMEHWNRKHAQAAYVPSIRSSPPPMYRYGPRALLCEGTDFLYFLRELSDGRVFYDPAMKLEAASVAPVLKTRSQFRIAFRDLPRLYDRTEVIDL